MSVEFSVVTGLLIGLVTLGAAFGAPYCFKNISPETHDTATKLICLYALFAVFRTVNFALIVGILRSAGDTTFCLLAETPIIWLVSVPLVFVGGLVFELNILWLFVLASVAEVLKTIVFSLRARGTKWIKLRINTPDSASPESAENSAPADPKQNA